MVVTVEMAEMVKMVMIVIIVVIDVIIVILTQLIVTINNRYEVITVRSNVGCILLAG